MGIPHNTQSPQTPHTQGWKSQMDAFLFLRHGAQHPWGHRSISSVSPQAAGIALTAVDHVQIRVVLSLRVHLPDVAESGTLVDDSPPVGSGCLSLVWSPSHDHHSTFEGDPGLQSSRLAVRQSTVAQGVAFTLLGTVQCHLLLPLGREVLQPSIPDVKTWLQLF